MGIREVAPPFLSKIPLRIVDVYLKEQIRNFGVRNYGKPGVSTSKKRNFLRKEKKRNDENSPCFQVVSRIWVTGVNVHNGLDIVSRFDGTETERRN